MRSSRRSIASVRPAAAAVLIVCVSVTTGPAGAYPRPGTTERVSVASDGAEGDNWSGSDDASAPAVSDDGTVVAFHSLAENLVPGDTNGVQDVFVHDRRARATTRVSVTDEGGQAVGASRNPSMSADGRLIVFESDGIGAGGKGVYLRDRATASTRRIATGAKPVVSAHGRYLAYEHGGQVYRYDLETESAEVASVASDGRRGNLQSQEASISGDGRYVAFRSAATNLDRDDGNGITNDIFVHDMESGRTDIASLTTEGEPTTGHSLMPSISRDGRSVGFWTYATNFAPNQPYEFQIVVHDRITEVTEVVSVGTDGRPADWWAWGRPSLSADGRYVAFRSGAGNLSRADTNGSYWDVFVHDRATGSTELASISADGASGRHNSVAPGLSADGRYVVFYSFADNLLGPDGDDANGAWDAFLRDRGPEIGVGAMTASIGNTGISIEGTATLSGRVVSSAVDSAEDSGLGYPAGGEITEASLAFRPEDEDLYFRIRLVALPGARGTEPNYLIRTYSVSGVPGIVYVGAFTAGGVTWEARVSGAAEHGRRVAYGVALFRCPAQCEQVSLLQGGVGTAGNEVRVSIPLDRVGLAPGTTMTSVRVFTATGEVAAGLNQTLDELAMPAVTVPAARVDLSVVPEASEPVYTQSASIDDGRFGALIPRPDAGRYHLWARSCLGAVCGPAARAQLVVP